ncbi:MAG: hypothetical protein ACKOC5_14640 [Chloroflexota bacterium]
MQCPHCKQEHADDTRVCPATNRPIGHWVVCPKCGYASRPGARHCAGCGGALPRQAPAPQPGAAPAQPPAYTQADSAARPEPADTGGAEDSRLQDDLDGGAAAPLALDGPLRKPAAAAPPVILENAAAWSAIPTSPRPEDDADGALRRPLVQPILLGLAALLLLVTLFQVWRAGRSSPPEPQPAAALPGASTALPSPPSHTPPAALPRLTQTPAAAPGGAATHAPTGAPPDLAHTATSITAAASPSPLAALPSATPAPAAPDYRLAFVSNRDAQQQVYLLDPSAPTEWLAVPLPADYESAGWPSFCGEQVAFEVEDRQLNLPRWIYLFQPPTGELERLAFAGQEPERAYSPGCSPSGAFMTVSTMLNNRWSLSLLERSTGEVRYQTPGAAYAQFGFASWTVAEDRFAWLGIKGNGLFDINLTVLQDSSGQTRRVLEGKHPAISPDGSRLAYFCGNLSYLCIAGWPSGDLLVQMPVSYFKQINKKDVPASAAWSADGQWVYFSSSLTGNWDIYRMHPDGSQVQNLTEGSQADEWMPAAR